MLLGFVFLGLFLFGIIAFGLSSMAGIDMDALSSGDMSQVTNMNGMKVIQLISSFMIFAFPAVMFAMIKSNNINLELNHSVNLKPIILSGLIILSSYPLIAILVKLNHSIPFPESLAWLETWVKNSEAQTAELMTKFLEMNSIGDLLLNLLVIAVGAAITEELLFRGVIQQVFQRWFSNPHIAIILTGAIFSAIHFQFYGFFARWALGIVLGYLFYWSKNLWYPIIAHFLNNGVQVFLVYLGAMDAQDIETSTVELDYKIWLAALASGVIFFFLNKMYYNSVKKEAGHLKI